VEPDAGGWWRWPDDPALLADVLAEAADDADTWAVHGHAMRWEVRQHVRAMPEIWLTGSARPSTMPLPITFAHHGGRTVGVEAGRVVGHVLAARDDGDGLHVAGLVWRRGDEDPHAHRAAVALLRSGRCCWSVTADITDCERPTAPPTEGHGRIRAARILAVGITQRPALRHTDVSANPVPVASAYGLDDEDVAAATGRLLRSRHGD